ncbi:SpoIIE family protein phosphatase [Actinokineospora sp. NBRC 105648]|uniref:SpoIIE family protein phosphatase n=1 Tax=Actinokineospora sp. NBRC 105648 TaxID=3032206 RepID=UPI002556A83D|nr:SpoIIE family protein phosphatase [Actinokineospora sp. NBRC 105648]
MAVGDLADLMASVDWADTPLGPPGTWDPQLRAVVRTMMSSRHQMILYWGPEWVAVYNDAYAATIGDKHPRALGRPAAHSWGELWELVGPLVRGVVADRESFWAKDFPFTLTRRGFLEQTYFDLSYDPVVVDSGAVAGVLCVVTETTGRVLGERRMRTVGALGARLAGLADVARIAAVAGEVLAENPDDLPSFEVRLFDGQDRDTEDRDGEPVWLDGPGPRRLALPLGSASGVVGELVVQINPMLPVAGPYREFLDVVAATLSSVLANALAQEQDRLRARALAELDQAKTELFATIGHELRTPLTLISGPAEDALADVDEPLGPHQRDRLELVRRGAGRLRRMVDNILDFTRIESGALRPDRVGTDLAELTRAVVASFRPAIERAGLVLAVDCPPLPREVFVDRDMWQRIVLNLLSNALKFTLSGEISLSVAEVDGQVELTVSDTGLGIPAEEIPLLFGRFHRVRGAGGRSQEGTGIGLALVSELVALHGGTIAVRSEHGRGATFTTRLPYGSGATRPADGPTESTVDSYLAEALGWTAGTREGELDPGAWAPIGQTAGACVLVVQDNADLRDFLVGLLEPHWAVVRATDGAGALTAVHRHRPDLVLTDVVLPGLDGFGLLAELRGNPSTEHIPVILLSARAGEQDAIAGLAAGADDYLVKPFSSPALIARVRSTLELAQLRNHQSAWREALVDSLDVGFFMIDVEGTILEMNAACAALLGYGSEGLPYRPPYPWWTEQRPGAVSAMRERLAAMLEGGGGRYVAEVEQAGGRGIWVAVAINVVPRQTGARRMFVGTARDITADVLAAERDQAQSSLAATLADATDVDEVLTAGATGLARAWQTQPAVVVCWPDGGGPVTAGEGDYPDWSELPEPVRAALEEARGSRSPQVVPEPGADGRALGIAAPIEATGPPTGVWLGFAPTRPVSDVDRYLFGALCAQFGVALTRARSFEEQRTVAVTLQRSILGPTNLPEGFAVRYEPALAPLEVGGDWYDVVALDADRVGVVVGDCVGRGLRAASVMGQLRSACRALLLRAISPADVLTALDDFADLLPGAVCTTLFCAIVDHAAGTLVYSSAGHPPAILLGTDDRATLLDAATSVPLAVPRVRPRKQATVDLAAGDTALLYTDGLVERRGETIDDGIDRAVRRLRAGRDRPVAELADRLVAELLPGGHDDDVAVLIYRHRG